MVVGLDHPLVADYLSRLEEAARGLPAGRRSELVDEIRGHVTEALAATGDDELGVRSVLDRVGSPEDIVAAERELLAAEPPSQHGATDPLPIWGPPAPEAVVPLSRPSSLWGPVEVIAVVGLTLGAVLFPIVGPIVGIACAWASHQWTRREKAFATLWAVVAPLVLLVGLGGLLFARTSVVEQGPVTVSSVPAVPEESSFPMPSVEVSP
jgi:hypothetical protein